MHRVPNILSSLRLILAPVFFFLFIQDEFLWRATGLTIYVIAAVTDYFDGALARKHQIETAIGVFLDPLADKFLTFSGFVVLAVIDPVQFPWWMVIAIVARDILITFFRLYTNRKKLPMATRVTAKIKTTIQMIFLYLAFTVVMFSGTDFIFGVWSRALLATDILWYLMLFVTFVTVYSGIEYLFVNKQSFRKQ